MLNRKVELRSGSRNYAAHFIFSPDILDALRRAKNRHLGKIECINEDLAIFHYQNEMYALRVHGAFTKEKQHHLYKKNNNMLQKVGHVYHRMEVDQKPAVDQAFVNKMKAEHPSGSKYFVDTSGERKRKREVIKQPSKPSKKLKVAKPTLTQETKPKPTETKTAQPRKRKETKRPKVKVPADVKELIILLLAHVPQSTGNLRHTLEKRGKKIDSEQFRQCIDEVADINAITKMCNLKPSIFAKITRQRAHDCPNLSRQELRDLLTKISQRNAEKKKLASKDHDNEPPKQKRKLNSNTEIPDANVLRKQEELFEQKRQTYEGYQRQITRISKKYWKLGEDWKKAKTSAAKGAKRTEIYTSYTNDCSRLRGFKREAEKLLKEMQEMKLQINRFYSKLNV